MAGGPEGRLADSRETRCPTPASTQNAPTASPARMRVVLRSPIQKLRLAAPAPGWLVPSCRTRLGQGSSLPETAGSVPAAPASGTLIRRGTMSHTIFHVTVATLVGAMTVAGVAIAMAPSRAGEPPKATKTAPAAAPVAAAIPAAPVAPPQPAAAPAPQPQAPPATSSNPLLDGCVISAIGRLPKADGLRVTKSSYEFLESNFIGSERTELYDVFVSVDLNGRQASYGWRCLVYGNRAATLHPR